MRNKIFLVVAIVTVAFGATPAWACSCGGLPWSMTGECSSAAAAATLADSLVFVGKVTALNRGTVEFEMSEVLAGALAKLVVVRNLPGCEYEGFEIGKEYLVSTDSVTLMVSLCGSVQKANEVPQSKIRLLRAVRDRRQGPDLFGFVAPARSNPGTPPESASGIAVTVKSDKAEFRTETASNGFYELRGLPTGTYQITMALPPGRTLNKYLQARRFDLTPGMLCAMDAQIVYDSVIAGTVVDAQGTELEGRIVAYRVEPDHSSDVPIGASVYGRFEITDVPPGRYRLEFGARRSSQSRPAPKEIVVAEGDHIETRIVIP